MSDARRNHDLQCWNSVGNSRSTTLEQRLPLHVLIMTNTIRELMCLVLVSQRNCMLIWNNTDLQRRSHKGNFGALSSLPMGTQKTRTIQSVRFTEACSRQISGTVWASDCAHHPTVRWSSRVDNFKCNHMPRQGHILGEQAKDSSVKCPWRSDSDLIAWEAINTDE